jgi:hypothetical protein
MFEVVGRTPAAARRKNCRSSRAERFDVVYLRAAQAYMLISMPTGTSTILGVFQVIPSSLKKFGVNSTPKLNLGPRPTPRKCGRSSVEHLRNSPDGRNFSPEQSDFSLGQGSAGDHADNAKTTRLRPSIDQLEFRAVSLARRSGSAQNIQPRKYRRDAAGPDSFGKVGCSSIGAIGCGCGKTISRRISTSDYRRVAADAGQLRPHRPYCRERNGALRSV